MKFFEVIRHNLQPAVTWASTQPAVLKIISHCGSHLDRFIMEPASTILGLEDQISRTPKAVVGQVELLARCNALQSEIELKNAEIKHLKALLELKDVECKEQRSAYDQLQVHNTILNHSLDYSLLVSNTIKHFIIQATNQVGACSVNDLPSYLETIRSYVGIYTSILRAEIRKYFIANDIPFDQNRLIIDQIPQEVFRSFGPKKTNFISLDSVIEAQSHFSKRVSREAILGMNQGTSENAAQSQKRASESSTQGNDGTTNSLKLKRQGSIGNQQSLSAGVKRPKIDYPNSTPTTISSPKHNNVEYSKGTTKTVGVSKNYPSTTSTTKPRSRLPRRKTAVSNSGAEDNASPSYLRLYQPTLSKYLRQPDSDLGRAVSTRHASRLE